MQEWQEKEQFNLEFGQRVKLARKAAKLRAEQTAELAGISPQFLSDVERGKKGVSNYNLLRLARALRVSADYLLLGRVGADEDWELTAERISSLPPAIRDMSIEVLNTALSMIQDNLPR